MNAYTVGEFTVSSAPDDNYSYWQVEVDGYKNDKATIKSRHSIYVESAKEQFELTNAPRTTQWAMGAIWAL